MPLPPIEPLIQLPAEISAALRARFEETEYNERILGVSESIAPGLLDPLRLPLVCWTLERQGDPAAQLARLFAYGDALLLPELHALLGKQLVPALMEAGILSPDPADSTRIRAPFRILPLEDLWILSDDPSAGGDCVMGPGPTTLQLLRMLPRQITGSVLDVGSGAGTLALVARRRGAEVVCGIDLNARAVDMARFNASLNGVSVEFRTGDLLQPVRGQQFSWVVSQPPFVIHPPDTPKATYLHGGPEGDEIALRLVGQLPEVLEPRGRALVLFDSPVRAGQPLPSRLRHVLEQAPVDLVLLTAPGPSPDSQAIAYASLESPTLGETFGASVRRYRAHLESLGSPSFTRALVCLIPGPEGTPPGGRFTLHRPVRSHAGLDAQALQTLFDSLELGLQPDPVLARSGIRVSPHTRWIEERPSPDPGIEPQHEVRFAPGGAGLDQALSAAGYLLLRLLVQATTVEEAVQLYAEVCQTEPEGVREKVLAYVREGLARGILEPRPREE